MMERNPITTVAELDQLDSAEILDGYWSGYDGEPAPGNNRSLSFWHGWRNGAVDGHHRKKDGAQAVLAHNYAEAQRKKKQ